MNRPRNRTNPAVLRPVFFMAGYGSKGEWGLKAQILAF
ncbi:hypothetical protein Cst_c10280 [Thermoclostridium stercorarium subsp. stercorarium DSM 8532]|uniref:Uncharacterized protein n=1 Tax=Thermoclostridium stercorarium (strain ATCC 35414 / DSM 8532 / NCIMB 11754) TaxID=1121335 RepID=L7VNI5_THES1|nr:hypothetical protein Cst_c10280 [Thermoclostridium stercorarium subsp. stercorarium DSM 8532]